tara:strand:+ start:457 stop:672 length:216 start_codon:yes stop_codon:yes gene_type:complete
MIEDKYKVEVKYQSDFQILLARIKQYIIKVIKPIIGLVVFISALYIGFYIVLFFIVFFLLLFLYNKVKSSL